MNVELYKFCKYEMFSYLHQDYPNPNIWKYRFKYIQTVKDLWHNRNFGITYVEYKLTTPWLKKRKKKTTNKQQEYTKRQPVVKWFTNSGIDPVLVNANKALLIFGIRSAFIDWSSPGTLKPPTSWLM